MKTISFDETEWQLVPKEPTDEMKQAASAFWYEKDEPAFATMKKAFGEMYEEMLAAAPKQTDGWTPIETAPRDGTYFMATSQPSQEMHVFTCCWSAYHPNAKGKECWRNSRICGDKLNPTHWMPLPPAPKKEDPRKESLEVEAAKTMVRIAMYNRMLFF